LSSNLSKIHFVLLAAGKSTRFKSKNNKILSKINNKTILEHNIDILKKIGFKKITLVINDQRILKNQITTNIEVIKGGKTRALSARNALIKSQKISKYVFIHDAARILQTTLIKKLIFETNKDIYDCIIPYAKCSDTAILGTKNISREKIKLIKTPQVFLKSKITKLHIKNNDYDITDDSKLIRNHHKKYKIKYLLDRSLNLKITFKEDIENIKNLYEKKIRVGLGYDIHRIQKLDKFNSIFLGGVKIKSKIAIISHSDGDVILHAITDSILGALSKRDIGTYFPNNQKNKNRNSSEFLNYALNNLRKEDYKINNIDIMIVSEIPKINPHYKKIIKFLTKILKINDKQITLKATTNERSGLIGRSEYIACWSNISIY